MSDAKQPENEAGGKTYCLLAAFETPPQLYAACEAVRDAGFTRWDAHSPFPIHGLDAAMGLKRSRVPLVSLVLALSGAAVGMLGQWWTSAHGYALTISGKPLFSWPAFVPVTFEVGVLGGAVGAVGGFLLFAGLPKHHHALFNSTLFERVTDDLFFISIEADDPKFDVQATRALLEELGSQQIELVTEG